MRKIITLLGSSGTFKSTLIEDLKLSTNCLICSNFRREFYNKYNTLLWDDQYEQYRYFDLEIMFCYLTKIETLLKFTDNDIIFERSPIDFVIYNSFIYKDKSILKSLPDVVSKLKLLYDNCDLQTYLISNQCPKSIKLALTDPYRSGVFKSSEDYSKFSSWYDNLIHTNLDITRSFVYDGTVDYKVFIQSIHNSIVEGLSFSELPNPYNRDNKP